MDSAPSLFAPPPPLAARMRPRTLNEFVGQAAPGGPGGADLRRVVEEARRHRDQGRRTVVLIDEIHRFNKAQQDALLPHVEEGLITLVGATTENPYFEIIGPLLSRAKVFML